MSYSYWKIWRRSSQQIVPDWNITLTFRCQHCNGEFLNQLHLLWSKRCFYIWWRGLRFSFLGFLLTVLSGPGRTCVIWHSSVLGGGCSEKAGRKMPANHQFWGESDYIEGENCLPLECVFKFMKVFGTIYQRSLYSHLINHSHSQVFTICPKTRRISSEPPWRPVL